MNYIQEQRVLFDDWYYDMGQHTGFGSAHQISYDGTDSVDIVDKDGKPITNHNKKNPIGFVW